MWPSFLFSTVYLPLGMQDGNGWPTWSPMSVSRKAPAWRIRQGWGGRGWVGEEDCHIQMLQICSLPHMWMGMPLSGALLVLHEHSQGDKPAETEVRPSVNLLWCWITRFTWLYPLIFSVVNSWRLSWLHLNWQFKQGTWELRKRMWHNVTEYWILVFDSLFWLCTLNCAVLCSPWKQMQLVLLHWKHIFVLFGAI